MLAGVGGVQATSAHFPQPTAACATRTRTCSRPTVLCVCSLVILVVSCVCIPLSKICVEHSLSSFGVGCSAPLSKHFPPPSNQACKQPFRRTRQLWFTSGSPAGETYSFCRVVPPGSRRRVLEAVRVSPTAKRRSTVLQAAVPAACCGGADGLIPLPAIPFARPTYREWHQEGLQVR